MLKLCHIFALLCLAAPPCWGVTRPCTEYVESLAIGGVQTHSKGATIALLGALSPLFPHWQERFLDQGWELRDGGFVRQGERVIPVRLHPYRLPGLVVDGAVDSQEGLVRTRGIALYFGFVPAMNHECLDGVCRLTYDQIGDLTGEETAQIQSIVDLSGTPIAVGGSAAAGRRRNTGSDLPYGKGEHEKSDIDYWFGDPNFIPESAAQLPGFDGKQLLSLPNPGIFFNPGKKPLSLKFVPFE